MSRSNVFPIIVAFGVGAGIATIQAWPAIRYIAQQFGFSPSAILGMRMNPNAKDVIDDRRRSDGNFSDQLDPRDATFPGRRNSRWGGPGGYAQGGEPPAMPQPPTPDEMDGNGTPDSREAPTRQPGGKHRASPQPGVDSPDYWDDGPLVIDHGSNGRWRDCRRLPGGGKDRCGPWVNKGIPAPDSPSIHEEPLRKGR